MRNPFRRTLSIDEGEAEALLFHYHKNGIPVAQRAAKALERRLCKFLGKETNDEYVAPCSGARHEGEIKGEQNIRDRLQELRREGECVGGDHRIAIAVREIQNKI